MMGKERKTGRDHAMFNNIWIMLFLTTGNKIIRINTNNKICTSFFFSNLL